MRVGVRCCTAPCARVCGTTAQPPASADVVTLAGGRARESHKPQQSHQHLGMEHVLSGLYFACTTFAVQPGKTPRPAG